MFNLSGSELIFLVLIALVVLGPDKLPEAMRKAGKAYADFKKMTTGFQSEMKSVLEEPMRELRETAELAKRSAMWDVDEPAKPVTARMEDHTPASDTATPPSTEQAQGPDPDASAAEPKPTTAEILAKLEVGDAVVASGTITPGAAVPVDPSPPADTPLLPSSTQPASPPATGPADEVEHADGGELPA